MSTARNPSFGNPGFQQKAGPLPSSIAEDFLSLGYRGNAVWKSSGRSGCKLDRRLH